MRARRPAGPDPPSSFLASTLAAIAVVGAAPPARAAETEADPFAEPPPAPQSNVAAPSQQAPASAPARVGRELPDRPRRAAAVVRVPGAGDPRPLRQLALARHAGPSVALLPAHRRRHLGLRLGRHSRTSARGSATPGSRTTTPSCSRRGVSRCALTPTYTNGSWFVQAQAELIANLNQLDAQTDRSPTPTISGSGPASGKVGRHRGPVRGVPRLPPRHGPGPQHRRAHRRLRRRPRTRPGPAALPRELPVLPAADPANIALHLYPGAFLRIELLAQWGNDSPRQHLGRPPRADLRPRLVQGPRRRRVPVAVRRRIPRPDSATSTGTAAWPARSSSCSPPGSSSGPNVGRAVTDVFTTRSSRTAARHRQVGRHRGATAASSTSVRSPTC